jgi:hypothetical protein
MHFCVFLYITNCGQIILEDWYRFRGGRTKTQGLMRESVGTMKNFPKRKFFVRALGSDISCNLQQAGAGKTTSMSA